MRAVTAHGHRLPSANLASATTLLPCPWRHPATLMLGPPAALMPAAAVAWASLLAAVPRLAGLLPCRLPAFRFRALDAVASPCWERRAPPWSSSRCCCVRAWPLLLVRAWPLLLLLLPRRAERLPA